ncbi:hypothetical protein ACFZAU_13840 [Streptomyces sp. NPDC008238]
MSAASPPPATNPFQAPDFGDGGTPPPDDAQEPAPGKHAPRRKGR